MLWVVIILAAILLIVILLLPSSITAKLSGVAVGVGMLFTAYTLYLSVQEEKRDTVRRQIDRDNDYWMRIFSSFIMQPSLRDMHADIYGNSLSVPEHSMFSMMMQVVENIAEGQQFGINQVDNSWKAAIAKWISHPSFNTYWRENKDDFSPRAQGIISSLLRDNYL